jgi:hypothetical protein
LNSFLRRFLLLFLGLGLATRLYICSSLADVPLWVWGLGLWNDLLAAVMFLGLTSPVLLVPQRFLRRALVAVLVAVVLIVAAAEAFYWIEFQARLDRLVFHYLAYPIEVLVFLDEQFYLHWVGVPFLLLAYGIAVLLDPPQATRGGGVLAGVALALVVAATARQDTIDPSRHLNQAASNGYLGVLTAAVRDVADIDSILPPAGAAPPPPQPDSHRSAGLAGSHVVVIIEESMAGPYWVDRSSRGAVFPNLMKLAEGGVLFDQAFATGTRTTRGLEAILNGFPPLPGISTTERAGFERLPSLARALAGAGYHTVFAYGGWPHFSNFTNYWRGIGFAETTSREDFLGAAFMTSWGASDDDLFRLALERMDAAVAEHDKVFLAMLTVSHHRPFELPPHSPYAGGRSATDALRYADAALGRYFEAARSKPWFDDTLFVIVADHGPKTTGETLIPVASYHVPLVLMHAGRLVPGRIDRAVTTMSVPRTVTNLLEVEHTQAFWGADLFAPQAGPLPVEHDYHVGWIVDGGLRVLTRDGDVWGWPAGAATAAPVPEAGLVGYFRAAHRAFYGAD